MPNVKASTFLSLSSEAIRGLEIISSFPFALEEDLGDSILVFYLPIEEPPCTAWQRSFSLQCLTLRPHCPLCDLELAHRQVDRQVWRKADRSPEGACSTSLGKDPPPRRRTISPRQTVEKVPAGLCVRTPSATFWVRNSFSQFSCQR